MKLGIWQALPSSCQAGLALNTKNPLKENAQLTEDLYGRGVLSAKLYDSLTESEESVFEGE
jgi:hypothetical protein